MELASLCNCLFSEVLGITHFRNESKSECTGETGRGDWTSPDNCTMFGVLPPPGGGRNLGC